MFKRRLFSLLLALCLALPLVFGVVGCGGDDPEDNDTTYSITYVNVEDATFASANPTSYKSTDNDITLVNPTKDGYTFIGWTGTGYKEPTLTIVIKKGSVGNRQYIANWQFVSGGTGSGSGEQEQTYNITYTGLEGSSFESANPNPTTYKNTDDDFTLVNPTKEGFVFIGWTGTCGETPVLEVIIAKNTHGNMMYIANWTEKTPPVQYIITYVFTNDGDPIDNSKITNYDKLPKTYTDDFSSPIIIPAPVHQNPTNYGFEGWYNGTQISGKGILSLSIEVGTTGNLTYTANFGYYTKNY